MSVNLRKYQIDSIDNIFRDWAEGHDDCLVVAATGAGKTIIFLALIEQILASESNARCMIVAHREELIYQPVERMKELFPNLWERTGIVMADQNGCHSQIVVGTVQTLAQHNRMMQVLTHGPINYLIIDEAHHAAADSYQIIIKTLKGINPSLKHLGVTATPIRSDGNGLPYQIKSAHYGIKELVSTGYLAPPRWLAIQTGISLSNVKTVYKNGEADFSQKGLVNVFETDNCFELVAESHGKYANGRKALAYTVSVDGAYRLAEEFNRRGIRAIAADGTTNSQIRRNILEQFRNGKYDVLCNCALWTEGLDLPEVSCIHQVRPTKSDGLYVQIIGRGLRLFPGKTDALILDYAPLEVRNITMMGDVLGIEARKDVYVQETEEPGEIVAGFVFDGKVKWYNGNPMEIVSRQLDYLDASPWRWNNGQQQGGWMILDLGPGTDGTSRILAISPASSHMDLWLIAKPQGTTWFKAHLFPDVGHTFEEISVAAADYAEKRGNVALARKAAGWRMQSPSEDQAKFAKKLRIWDNRMSRGTCADAITYKLATDALRRAGVL